MLVLPYSKGITEMTLVDKLNSFMIELIQLLYINNFFMSQTQL